MSAEITAKAEKWLQSNIDEDAKKAIRQMLEQKNGSELVDAFYKDLEFGTGGLRGIMGIGSNRMNKYTVGKATQGLSNYLLKTFPGQEIRVAIAHDSRNNSRFFAEITASVFSANGIKVYLFGELRPTPELSFAVRELGCKSGVVITASHNPKEYNGYKVYWDDGAQIVPPHDKEIIEEVNKITDLDTINFDQQEDNIALIEREIDEKYLRAVQRLSVSPEAIQSQNDLKIVFSSIHGTGVTIVPPCLKAFGFTNVHVVEEQATPDGNFPTVVYPNPEESEAMKISLEKAKEIDADLVMATDPDADRVGIAVKNDEGEFQLLNGNQTGSLLTLYMLKKWKENQLLDGKQFIVKTIVTTELISEIAKAYDVACFDTLTGFKYIAMIIRELEGKKKFIVGGEESYGYLVGDFVRDKDAVSSCAMIAEMTAYAKDQGKSLFQWLKEMYLEFGFYKEKLIYLVRKGKSGAEEIQAMMKQYRKAPPLSLNGSRVTQIRDYQNGLEKYMETGEETQLDFPKSNVLQFFTDDGSKISARPSGTEPKIKFYISVRSDLDEIDDFKKVEAALNEKINRIESDLLS